jgi:hypothetical protein
MEKATKRQKQKKAIYQFESILESFENLSVWHPSLLEHSSKIRAYFKRIAAKIKIDTLSTFFQPFRK